MPDSPRQPVYQSGECEIDIARRELRIDGTAAPLGARALEILEILVRSDGALINKEHLVRRIWPGAYVPDNTLQVHISAIRKAFGRYRGLLRTESGRGYRLVGGWTARQQEAAPKPVEIGRAPIALEPAPTNLPARAFDLIGRDETVRQLQDLLSAYRVVTLTGPGGIGKTALALEVAHMLLPGFKGGGWLIELASISDGNLVPTAISTAADLRLGSDAISAEAVARAIDGNHLLLVLDNCEHVIDAAAGFAETVLHLCPHATLLATSREVLRIGGEHVYRVPPLAVPSSNVEKSDDILNHSAVELFVARTRAQDSTFLPDATGLSAVAGICRHLDGIPLAIEFAAARAATLGLPQVAAMLDDRFRLLTGGRRTALPRHQTLRATLDWSYELLTEAERVTLRRLAIFAGPFSLDAATTVAASPEIAAPQVVECLASLVAKSLVAIEGDGTIARYRLLETTRAYAAEKLEGSGEREPLALRHAEYYRGLFEQSEAELESRPTAEWLADYAWCVDNVRAALHWTFSPGGDASIGMALTAAAVPLWMHLSLVAECRERCDRALLTLQTNQMHDLRLRMRLQIGLGNSLLHTRGPSERAQAVLAEALESAEALGDLNAQLRVLLDLSSVDGFRGEYARAAAASERARAIAQQIGDTASVAFADRRMGMILLRIGRIAEAQRSFERVIQAPPSHLNEDQQPIWRHSDDRAMARALLARALWLQGFPERAQHEAQASLGEVRGSDHQLTLCRVLFYGMGRIAPMTGDFAAAKTAISSIIESGTRAAAPFWTTAGQFLHGKLLVERHQFVEGLAVLRDAFDICERTGWQFSAPEFMGSLALALAGLGRLDEAHDAVCKAVEMAGRGEDGQQWYLPELLRIEGEVLLKQSSSQAVQAAAACFDQAAELAREQGALSWELRIALSRARWLVAEDRTDAASKVLAPVYCRFAEGFDTADMVEAKALLDALPASGGPMPEQ